MPITRVLDRVRDGLTEVLERRSAPEDKIDFDASIVLVDIEEGECPDCGSEHEGHRETAVSVYVALSCPELGEHTQSMCHLTVPLAMLTDAEEVAEVGNDLWDRLQSSRMVVAAHLFAEEDLPEEG